MNCLFNLLRLPWTHFYTYFVHFILWLFYFSILFFAPVSQHRTSIVDGDNWDGYCVQTRDAQGYIRFLLQNVKTEIYNQQFLFTRVWIVQASELVLRLTHFAHSHAYHSTAMRISALNYSKFLHIFFGFEYHWTPISSWSLQPYRFFYGVLRFDLVHCLLFVQW